MGRFAVLAIAPLAACHASIGPVVAGGERSATFGVEASAGFLFLRSELGAGTRWRDGGWHSIHYGGASLFAPVLGNDGEGDDDDDVIRAAGLGINAGAGCDGDRCGSMYGAWSFFMDLRDENDCVDAFSLWLTLDFGLRALAGTTEIFAAPKAGAFFIPTLC